MLLLLMASFDKLRFINLFKEEDGGYKPDSHGDISDQFVFKLFI
jgi:hypothetical protein